MSTPTLGLEVTAALERAALETGVAYITEDMALRDAWRYVRIRSAGPAARANGHGPFRVTGYTLRFPAWGPTWLSLLATGAYLTGDILSPDLQSALSS